MSSQVIVCKGCCCGNVEKGHNEVPDDYLEQTWGVQNIDEKVKLTISGCLGPCGKHNICVIKTDGGQIWLGELVEIEHYEAIVGWAREVRDVGRDVKIPENLESHRFEPEEKHRIRLERI